MANPIYNKYSRGAALIPCFCSFPTLFSMFFSLKEKFRVSALLQCMKVVVPLFGTTTHCKQAFKNCLSLCKQLLLSLLLYNMVDTSVVQ